MSKQRPNREEVESDAEWQERVRQRAGPGAFENSFDFVDPNAIENARAKVVPSPHQHDENDSEGVTVNEEVERPEGGESPDAGARAEADQAGGAAAAAPEATSPEADGASSDATTEDKILTMLKTVYDPEIPVDIHELGLIYSVDLGEDGVASIRMTLTSPNCPAAESLPGEVETKVKTVEGVTDAKVEIVWDPPWTPDLMSEAAKLELGMW